MQQQILQEKDIQGCSARISGNNPIIQNVHLASSIRLRMSARHVVHLRLTFIDSFLLLGEREGGRCRPPKRGTALYRHAQLDLKSDCCEYQDLQSAKSHCKCLYSMRPDCKSDRAGEMAKNRRKVLLSPRKSPYK